MRILFLLASLTLTACNSPPPPPPQQPKTMDEIDQIVHISDNAIVVVRKVGTGAPTADVQAAMREMNDALDAARKQINEVTKRVATGEYFGRGSIDPVNVSACIDGSTFEASSIEEMSKTLRFSRAMDVGECAINTSVYFTAVSGEDAAAVALAVAIIYPLALIAHAQAGVGAGAWLQQYRAANEAIIAKLAPQCQERKGANSAGTGQVRYECAAYEVAMSVRPNLEASAGQVVTSP